MRIFLSRYYLAFTLLATIVLSPVVSAEQPGILDQVVSPVTTAPAAALPSQLPVIQSQLPPSAQMPIGPVTPPISTTDTNSVPAANPSPTTASQPADNSSAVPRSAPSRVPVATSSIPKAVTYNTIGAALPSAAGTSSGNQPIHGTASSAVIYHAPLNVAADGTGILYIVLVSAISLALGLSIIYLYPRRRFVAEKVTSLTNSLRK